MNRLERLMSALRISNTGYWEWDPEKTEMEWSDEVYEIHGVSRTDFSPNVETILALTHPDDRPRLHQVFNDVINGKVVHSCETRLIRPDGELRYGISRAEVVPSEEGSNKKLIIGTFTDITEQKLAEKNLTSFLQIFDASDDYISFVDNDFIYRAVNHRYIDAFQKTKECIINQSVADLLGNELFENQVKPLFTRCLAGEVVNLQHWHQTPKYGKRFVDAKYSPIYEQGKIVGIAVSARDITERKKSKDALQKNEAKLKTAQRIAQLGYWEEVFEDGKVLLSDEACQILRVDTAEFTGSFDALLDYIHPEDRGLVKRLQNLAIANRTSNWTNFRTNPVTGSIRHLHSHSELIHDESDAAASIVVTFMDVTEQKLAENEAISAKFQNNAKSEFLARMSHEIRTPMNGILGILQLLKETELDNSQKELIHVMENSGQVLRNVVNDILDYSKMEEQKLVLEQTTFNLHELINNCAALYAHEADQKSILLSVKKPLNIPTVVSGDPTRLQQVITNLVSNAIKFTDEGSITIEASVVNKNAGEGKKSLLRFSVFDTGIGMNEEQKTHIFDRFVQSDTSITRRFGGTGLGLSICQYIVNQMGGNISVDSEPGQGSTFWFEVTLTEQMEKTSEKPDKETSTATMNSAHILVAEDNPTNQFVISAMLKKMGHTFDVVENGEQAVAKVKSSAPFDLILMDCEMPAMDGYTASKTIIHWETEQSHQHTPIIALSAHATAEYEQNSYEAGMDFHLRKPIEFELLQETIERYCTP